MSFEISGDPNQPSPVPSLLRSPTREEEDCNEHGSCRKSMKNSLDHQPFFLWFSLYGRRLDELWPPMGSYSGGSPLDLPNKPLKPKINWEGEPKPIHRSLPCPPTFHFQLFVEFWMSFAGDEERGRRRDRKRRKRERMNRPGNDPKMDQQNPMGGFWVFWRIWWSGFDLEERGSHSPLIAALPWIFVAVYHCSSVGPVIDKMNGSDFLPINL